MSTRFVHRLLVYLALSAYGATALVGQGLHELLDCHHHEFPVCQCGHGHDGHDQLHSDRVDVDYVVLEEHNADHALDDDDCAICQFHAQGQLNSLQAPELSGVQVVAGLTISRSQTVLPPALRAFDSRGPPLATTTF